MSPDPAAARNVGIQSSTILVRALATGELSGEREASVLSAEVLVGLLIGIVAALLVSWQDVLGAVGSWIFVGVAIVLLAGPYSEGWTFVPDKGNFWYYWQRSDATVWSRLSAWVPYAVHTLSMWYLIAQARHVRPRYIFGLHWFNVWALAVPGDQSGVSRPSSGLWRATALGTRYDAFRSELHEFLAREVGEQDGGNLVPPRQDDR